MDFLKTSDATSLAIAYIGAVRVFVARILQNAAAKIAPENARHTFGAASSSLRPPTMRITPTPCFLRPTASTPVSPTGSQSSWLLSGLGVWSIIGLLFVVLLLAGLSCFLANARANLQRQVAAISAACANLEKQVAAVSVALSQEVAKTGCNLGAHKDIEGSIVDLINALAVKAPYQTIRDIPWMVNTGRPRGHNKDGTVLVSSSVTKPATTAERSQPGFVVERHTPVNIAPPPSEPLGPEPYPWHRSTTSEISRAWQPYQH